MGNIFYSVVIYPLTQIIELVFTFGNKLFDNTGIAILGVSLAVSMFTLPLYIIAEHWQEVERQLEKRMKPEVDKIKAVFKGNEQYMILSTYYRQQHYHPIMSLRSAFGLLIQIPFFTAAYTCLSHLSALQGHSFLFIQNMGAPDALFTIAGFNVNVLPIAMTLINCISGMIYTKGLSLRDKLQVYGLALIFVCILYDSPAGLVMYWTMNNIFSLVKNIFYKMKHPVQTLYFIICGAITVFIVWLFTGHILSVKRALLVSVVFALAYFAPLFVKLSNYLIDNVLTDLRDNSKKRIQLFLFSSIGLCLLAGLLIPSLLVASSPMEFSGIDSFGSPMYFIMNTFVQSIGLFIVWPSLIFFLYHERMQSLIATFFVILLSFAILNGFLFQEDYGNLSKLLMFTNISTVDSSIKLILANLFVMAVISIAILALLKFKVTKYISMVAGLISVSVAMVSFVNFGTINKGYKQYEELTKAGQSTSGPIKTIFHFSKTGKNVLYLYLDRAQNRFIEPLFEECPELYEQFSGFTLYKNTVSFNGHTLLGAAPCYGGYEYNPENMNVKSNQTLASKQNEALLLLPRIFTEQIEGYSATVTDPSWANYSWIPDLGIYKNYPKISSHLTDNNYLDRWYKDHKDTAEISVTSETLERNILWYSLFRIAPLVLRPAFYNDGNYWSANSKNDDFDDYLAGYSVLDYLPELTDTESETPNAYINFVNNTTHDGMILQAPDFVPVANVTNKGTSKFANDRSYHSMAGAIKRVGDWFDYLKANGIYDNTRIVIVADHGASSKEDEYNWDEKFDEIRPGRFHPLLMFKDFGESGPLKLNYDFMTNADTPVLLTQNIINNPTNPFTGKIIDSSEKEKGALICSTDIFMPYQNDSQYIFTPKKNEWWRVKGNIFDSASWNQEER